MVPVYVGIDPGRDGAIAAVNAHARLIAVLSLKGYTWPDRVRVLQGLVDRRDARVYLERVHSMPRQGVASSFTFGSEYGGWLGVLAALGLRHELVAPQNWQRSLGCMSGGDKGVTLAAAHAMWPDHAKLIRKPLADACLIAEYGRRLDRVRATAAAVTGYTAGGV